MVVIIAAATVAACVSVQFMAIAHADYTPAPAPFISRVGTAGTLVQDQNTNLDPADAMNRWNAWTARSYLSMGTAGCGSTTSCISYANSGAQLYYTSCYVPTTSYYASTYVAAGTYENTMGCPSVGSYTNPVFVVSFNNSTTPAYAYYHVQRHEMGHALALGDATVSCWYASTWYPLMNNGTTYSCGGYGYNWSGTTNEINAVTTRNGW